MKTENSKSASLWTKAPVANLVRYEPSGIYFARAKVRGKLIRKSLDTNVLSVAKLRLADLLDTEHKAVAPSHTKIVGKMVFADALAIFKERQKHATEIKERTKEYNERAADALLKTWPGLEQIDVKRITKFDCLEWRARFGKLYSPTVINGTLSILRRVLDVAVDAGARYDNPAKDKDVKRARVRRKELQLPERCKPAEVCRQLNINYITFQQWQQRAMEGMLQALESRVNLTKGEALSPRLQTLLQNRQRAVTVTKLTSRLEQINKIANPPSLPAKTE